MRSGAYDYEDLNNGEEIAHRMNIDILNHPVACPIYSLPARSTQTTREEMLNWPADLFFGAPRGQILRAQYSACENGDGMSGRQCNKYNAKQKYYLDLANCTMYPPRHV